MFLRLFAIALPVFLAIDLVWLGLVAKNLYAKQIGHLLRPDVNWAAALTFYVLFVAGLVFFVIAPAAEKKSWLQTLTNGAFFGLVTYATYDLTNLAVAKGWPLGITIIDLAWGSFLAASVSAVTYAIAAKFA